MVEPAGQDRGASKLSYTDTRTQKDTQAVTLFHSSARDKQSTNSA